MEDILRGILLGIIQGLTEFLPISSSGHLEIINHLMGESENLNSDLLTVIIAHVGTAFSILYVFRKDIYDLVRGVFAGKRDSLDYLLLIIISMIPAGIIGLLFESRLEELFSQSTLIYVGLFFLVTALILWFTPKSTDSLKGIQKNHAFIIGVAQAIAILPGISRSGFTIASGLYCDLDKDEVAKFSFIMVLPLIFGKLILDLFSDDLTTMTYQIWPILATLISSFLVGICACKWMLDIVKSSKLSYFAIYCLVLGLITMASQLM